MNEEQIKGKADQFLGKLKETYGRLSGDELALYNGKREQFVGKVTEKYGIAKQEAEDKLKELEASSKQPKDWAA
jgi:uncharacterized protein YjbJ (UPF0337 family)